MTRYFSFDLVGQPVGIGHSEQRRDHLVDLALGDIERDVAHSDIGLCSHDVVDDETRSHAKV